MKKTLPYALIVLLLGGLSLYFFALPKPLFDADYSTVLYDSDGELLGARIANDEQWRFPLNPEVNERFSECILLKEDKYFRYHPGVNPVSLLRALYLNISEGKVVSGGSTISMQVIRLSRGNPPRTIKEKVWEICLALILEMRYSKDEILAFYCSHAPFGGNVVGLETASWRYFQRGTDHLSWAELATLAVLPNAPGMIHPGKNQDVFRKKRDEMLLLLYKQGVLDEAEFELALLEQIPRRPRPLPDLAPHLMAKFESSHNGQAIFCGIEKERQSLLSGVVNRHSKNLSENQIHNACALLINNHTGKVEAYVGNSRIESGVNSYNDMITTPRSSGSILKPFLYASMLESGELLPNQLVSDIPTHIAGFAPENFNKSFDGMVPASEALSRSLNVPAVRMLQEYSVPRFLSKLQDLKLSSIDQNADHYGLSLILGGAEVKALNLGLAYSSMAQKLLQYNTSGAQKEFRAAYDSLLFEEAPYVPFSMSSIYQTLEVLTTVNRPDSEMGWQRFGRSNVAWKTGTSYGHRDAWAVGVTNKYTCVVWAGNASGEGRPGLVGAIAAGPLLFEIMNALPSGPWFTTPLNEMKEVPICELSGFRAGEHCDNHRAAWVPAQSTSTTCPYHKQILVNAKGERVLRQCSKGPFKFENILVLPPAQSWYYQKNHPYSRQMPGWSPNCTAESGPNMEVIYPQYGSEIFIPTDIGGEREKLVMEVVHRENAPKLYWHLNGRYVGQTEEFHQLSVDLAKGEYDLHVEDAHGNAAETRFSVVSEQ